HPAPAGQGQGGAGAGQADDPEGRLVVRLGRRHGGRRGGQHGQVRGRGSRRARGRRGGAHARRQRADRRIRTRRTGHRHPGRPDRPGEPGDDPQLRGAALARPAQVLLTRPRKVPAKERTMTSSTDTAQAGERAERTLAGKTLLISGGSRGIGEAIAVRAAADGANVALIAKTAEPHPKLPGTIYTAAEAIERAGGQALPIVGDIRNDEVVEKAVAQTVERFGGIDIVVNNASAINLSPTEHIPMKAYDLMQDINTRGAFLLSKACIEHLRRSAAAGRNPHILTLSPPIRTEPKWFGTIGTAYTIAKFGMSLVTLGLSEELRADGIAANSLWPRTTIDTAAVRNLLSDM